ncbi:hypothetical protein RRG08_026310 [Elysia crispata]|uniref:Uncharacterized protein n=1 Tax=Elysia crispata TaxID=231223 RepID=A0AAE0ZAN8_9GAST|nr:hypothetical protein RRG08_026310 [Elysia crispata]
MRLLHAAVSPLLLSLKPLLTISWIHTRDPHYGLLSCSGRYYVDAGVDLDQAVNTYTCALHHNLNQTVMGAVVLLDYSV